jgi:hypothetical protein
MFHGGTQSIHYTVVECLFSRIQGGRYSTVVEFFIQVSSLLSIVSGHIVQQYIHMEGDRGNTL